MVLCLFCEVNKYQKHEPIYALNNKSDTTV